MRTIWNTHHGHGVDQVVECAVDRLGVPESLALEVNGTLDSHL
jgi:hypothetical protein